MINLVPSKTPRWRTPAAHRKDLDCIWAAGRKGARWDDKHCSSIGETAAYFSQTSRLYCARPAVDLNPVNQCSTKLYTEGYNSARKNGINSLRVNRMAAELVHTSRWQIERFTSLFCRNAVWSVEQNNSQCCYIVHELHLPRHGVISKPSRYFSGKTFFGQKSTTSLTLPLLVRGCVFGKPGPTADYRNGDHSLIRNPWKAPVAQSCVLKLGWDLDCSSNKISWFSSIWKWFKS